MKYEPVFKFAEYNVFMTDLFFQPYGEVDSIITIKNGKWEFFIAKDSAKRLAEEGFNFAFKRGFYDKFKKKSLSLGKELLGLNKEEIDSIDNEEFLLFLENFFDLGKRFAEEYKKTEFFYFRKIEKEINEYIQGKFFFEDILSNKVDLASWPKDKKALADYIISMQHLKIKLRKFINEVLIGEKSICSRILKQIIKRTGRDDSIDMTLAEIKNCLNGIRIPEVYPRHIYSYIKFKDGNINILSGGDAYRKIRELEKEIPKNEVIGTPANKGVMKGKVKIIPLSLNPEQYLSKLEKGDILVSDTTGPEMMPIIKKAAAIVTDEGGMMSHAAIVAREFNIPCVVGTKYATKVFKDGEMIEVNANNGVVRKID